MPEVSEVMSIAPREVDAGRRCLVYCGDDHCTCAAGPLGLGRILLDSPTIENALRIKEIAVEKAAVAEHNSKIARVLLDPYFLRGGEGRYLVRRSPHLGIPSIHGEPLSPLSPKHEDYLTSTFGRPSVRLKVRSRWRPLSELEVGVRSPILTVLIPDSSWDGDCRKLVPGRSGTIPARVVTEVIRRADGRWYYWYNYPDHQIEEAPVAFRYTGT